MLSKVATKVKAKGRKWMIRQTLLYQTDDNRQKKNEMQLDNNNPQYQARV